MSRIIWCELKVTTLRSDNTILLNNFDQQQAAFMYKWQRAGGQCFVLLSVIARQEIGYAIITQLLEDDWLRLNKRRLTSNKIFAYYSDIKDILLWFEQMYIQR